MFHIPAHKNVSAPAGQVVTQQAVLVKPEKVPYPPILMPTPRELAEMHFENEVYLEEE